MLSAPQNSKLWLTKHRKTKTAHSALRMMELHQSSPEGRILEVLSRFSLEEQKVILGKVTDVITEKNKG